MDNVVITIARQYGSGGKTIAAMLAKDLGINCYSREILKMASEESGINERLFGMTDEKLKGAGWLKLLKRPYEGELLPPESSGFVSDENLFNYQSKVIKDLAATESKYYTGHEWTDARNYHLCLDSGKLGFQKCVEEIKAYMKIRFDQE